MAGIHRVGNKTLKFEEDDLTDMQPIYDDNKEIIGYVEKDPECEHEFEYEENWKENIDFDTCLRIPVKCSKCGLRADQTWTDFIYTDKNTGETI